LQSNELDLGKAAEYLKVSRRKLWQLARDGIIQYKTSPLDRRKKLFKKSDLETLLRGEIPNQEATR
jgi:excisionase family DNA binding protein